MEAEYFNTTNLEGKALSERIKSSAKQSAKILDLFIEKKTLTPSEVYEYFNREFPITSARRAINVLTDKGYLVKTDKKKVGLFGATEHYWSCK